MIAISEKQGEMLAFIEDFVVQNGYPPTREEIRTGLNISTKSLVNYHLEALEDASLLTRVPNTPRGLRLACQREKRKPSNDLISETTADFPSLDHSQILELTYGMVTNDSNMYALKIENNTMLDAQVSDGDVVILQHQLHTQNGETVVVKLLKHNKTAIKQYYRENGHVRLQSTNPTLKPIIVTPEAVEIQGKVVAIIRQVDY
jgi:repressor LexA